MLRAQREQVNDRGRDSVDGAVGPT